MSDVRIDGLHKSFGPTEVLRGLDLTVPAGCLAAVLGPSGCGKTTLLRLVAGFEQPDQGRIALGGEPLDDGSRHVPAHRRRIGYVPQEGLLFPHLSVAQNVAFGLPRRRRQAARVQELLELVGLTGLEQRSPADLSGGQQQRVALARALAPAPHVVLLDEPFAALDAGLREGLRADVKAALAAVGATVVLVTHDQDEALSLADLVAVMGDGRIAQAATPRELYEQPASVEVARFVGEANLVPASIDREVARTALGTLPLTAGTAPVTGRAVVLLRPEQVLLSTDGHGPEATVLSTSYHGHDAVVAVALREQAAPARLLVRTTGALAPAPGSTVRLAFTGSVVAFAEQP